MAEIMKIGGFILRIYYVTSKLSLPCYHYARCFWNSHN